MKKTIAILTVLLLLLSGCKAVKNNQAGTAATPVTDSQAEQNDQANEDLQAEMPAPENSTDVNDSEDQNSETSKETASERTDDSWKEELGWDDSWTKLEPMSYEEAIKIIDNNQKSENEFFSPLTSEERMAYYVYHQKEHRKLKDTPLSNNSDEWFIHLFFEVPNGFDHDRQEYFDSVFAAFIETAGTLAEGINAEKLSFGGIYPETGLRNIYSLVTEMPYNYTKIHSNPQKNYSFDEIEQLCNEFCKFLLSFEDIVHFTMDVTTPKGWGSYDT